MIYRASTVRFNVKNDIADGLSHSMAGSIQVRSSGAQRSRHSSFGMIRHGTTLGHI